MCLLNVYWKSPGNWLGCICRHPVILHTSDQSCNLGCKNSFHLFFTQLFEATKLRFCFFCLVARENTSEITCFCAKWVMKPQLNSLARCKRLYRAIIKKFEFLLQTILLSKTILPEK